VTVELCTRMIDSKFSEWGDDPQRRKNLNPTTLFRKDNFDRYVAFLDEGVIDPMEKFIKDAQEAARGIQQ